MVQEPLLRGEARHADVICGLAVALRVPEVDHVNMMMKRRLRFFLPPKAAQTFHFRFYVEILSSNQLVPNSGLATFGNSERFIKVSEIALPEQGVGD